MGEKLHNALIKPTGNITQSCALRGNFKNSYEEGGILIDKFFLLASVCIYAVKFFCSRESVIFIKTYRNKTQTSKNTSNVMIIIGFAILNARAPSLYMCAQLSIKKEVFFMYQMTK